MFSVLRQPEINEWLPQIDIDLLDAKVKCWVGKTKFYTNSLVYIRMVAMPIYGNYTLRSSSLEPKARRPKALYVAYEMSVLPNLSNDDPRLSLTDCILKCIQMGIIFNVWIFNYCWWQSHYSYWICLTKTNNGHTCKYVPMIKVGCWPFHSAKVAHIGLSLTLNAPIAIKVVCFSRLLKCLRSLYDKQCGPRSDSTLFASILNSSVKLDNYLSADDFSRRHFQMHYFLAL